MPMWHAGHISRLSYVQIDNRPTFCLGTSDSFLAKQDLSMFVALLSAGRMGANRQRRPFNGATQKRKE